MSEKFIPQSGDVDLNNAEIITNILETGSPEELARLADFHSIPQEKLHLFRYFAKMRREILDKMDNEVEKRVHKNPEATKEEMNMGSYLENIEPQVRDAVLSLRKKGYSTFESGFGDYNEQRIRFERDDLNHFVLPRDLIDQLKKQNIHINIDPSCVSFTLNNPLSLDEIKNVWINIEATLPDLKRSAPDCQIGTAKIFRDTQQSAS